MLKSSAGLVNLKGFDRYVARVLTDAIYETYQINPNISERAIFMTDLMKNLRGKGLTFDSDYGIKLKDFMDLKGLSNNENLGKVLNTIPIIFSYDINTHALGSFSGIRLPIAIYLAVFNLVQASMLFGSLEKRELYHNILNTFGHELQHAIDWVLSRYRKTPFGFDKVPGASKGDPKLYYNQDTELKSWAYSAAHSIMEDRLESFSDVDYLLNLTTPKLMGLMQLPKIKESWNNILPENRKDFLQRVLKEIRREALRKKKELQEEFDADFSAQDKPKYLPGKSRSKWV